MTITQEEAEREAAYELRFTIGNMPHLSDPEYDGEAGAYVFEIRYTHPELPDLDAGEEKVTYYESQTIGEMRVFDDGSIERTSNEELEKQIQKVRERVDTGEIDEFSTEDEN